MMRWLGVVCLGLPLSAAAAEPAAEWLFEETGTTVTDSSGNDNDAALGSASRTAAAAPVVGSGQALLLQGANDRVVVPHSDSLAFDESFSFAAWIRADGTGDYVIVSKDSAGIPTNYNVWIHNNRFRFVVSFTEAPTGTTSDDAGVAGCDPGGCWVESAAPFIDAEHPVGTWRFVAGVYDDTTKSIRLYTECGPAGEGSFATAGRPFTSADDVQIGERKAFSGQGDFFGAIDDLRLWPVALTEEEIAATSGCNPDLTDCGLCDAYTALGEACATDDECASGACVDDVCCEEACGAGAGDCQACSIAAGSSADGTCEVLEQATVCREAEGDCDIAETCDGTSRDCPSDEVEPAMTVCREAVGDCDIVESCDGTSPDCPDDEVEPATTVCREAVGDCDVSETCDGATADCPTDQLAADGTVCDDGSLCTTTDVCAAGTCEGEAVVCEALDECHEAGECDPLTGTCDDPEIPDCENDGDPVDTGTAGTGGGGCGCVVQPPGASSAPFLLLLGLLARRRRSAG